ncbi:hypothetical protein [Paractinoplanes globisporus]|uniref:Secreted protein n=1 Tax=Paractinoplanes globisporus TaxID=113565 RepID=A0ABW6W921_9ACTN|nr:hypothetical protein [Actinoplanes globisporus]
MTKKSWSLFAVTTIVPDTVGAAEGRYPCPQVPAGLMGKLLAVVRVAPPSATVLRNSQVTLPSRLA